MSKTADRGRRKAGRPRDENKRAAILCAAGECFLKGGLSGTNMDAIARAADVSKITVYNHFSDKESLFKAVIAAKCAEFAPPESLLGLASTEPRAALTEIAGRIMRLMMSPEVVAMHRVVPTEAMTNPRIARLFFEAGPQPMLKSFADLLRDWVARGKMDIAEPDRASDHFFSMLEGTLHFKLVMNLEKQPSATELKRHVDDCVDMFLRAYLKR